MLQWIHAPRMIARLKYLLLAFYFSITLLSILLAWVGEINTFCQTSVSYFCSVRTAIFLFLFELNCTFSKYFLLQFFWLSTFYFLQFENVVKDKTARKWMCWSVAHWLLRWSCLWRLDLICWGCALTETLLILFFSSVILILHASSQFICLCVIGMMCHRDLWVICCDCTPWSRGCSSSPVLRDRGMWTVMDMLQYTKPTQRGPTSLSRAGPSW